MKNRVLIGDVHSQSHLLEQALNYIRDNVENSQVIFLGDLFDSRCDFSDSVGVYNLVRRAELDMNAIIIQSNHQDKLIRHLRGNKIVASYGIDRTIKEFSESDLSDVELRTWLERMSYGVVFRDHENLEYRCAHAYFSSSINIHEYDNIYHVKALSNKNKAKFIYGIKISVENKASGRLYWWKDSQKEHRTNHDWIRVAGHYHTVHVDTHSVVIDGGCGSGEENSCLVIYDVNQKKLINFK
jgi:hypothetical protein